MSDDSGIEVLDLSSHGDGDGVDVGALLSKYGNKVLAGVIAVAVLATAMTSVFQVNTDSVGVVLRFGEIHRTVEPGLQMKLPLGIESHHLVPTRKQLKQEFGFRTVAAGEETEYDRSGYEDESLMLTGDLNVVDVQWTIQYRITDAEKYLFEVRDVGDTLRFLTQAIMREIVGDRTVNEVLTVGRTELAVQVRDRLQERVESYQMGVTVSDVILQDVTPPGPVRPAFDEVNQAQQDRERLINEARQAYNEAVPRARGEKEQTVQRAEGYEIRRINRAEGQITRFDNLYNEYQQAPEITRQRIYLETFEEMLPGIDEVTIIDAEADNTIPILPSGTTPESLGIGGGNQ